MCLVLLLSFAHSTGANSQKPHCTNPTLDTQLQSTSPALKTLQYAKNNFRKLPETLMILYTVYESVNSV